MQLRNLTIAIRYKKIHLLGCQSLSSNPYKCSQQPSKSLSFRTVSATPQAIGHLFPWKRQQAGRTFFLVPTIESPWCFLCVTWKLLGNP